MTAFSISAIILSIVALLLTGSNINQYFWTKQKIWLSSAFSTGITGCTLLIITILGIFNVY